MFNYMRFKNKMKVVLIYELMIHAVKVILLRGIAKYVICNSKAIRVSGKRSSNKNRRILNPNITCITTCLSG